MSRRYVFSDGTTSHDAIRRDEEADGMAFVLSRIAGLDRVPEPTEDPPGTLYHVVERDTYTGVDRDCWVVGENLTAEQADEAITLCRRTTVPRYSYRKVAMGLVR